MSGDPKAAFVRYLAQKERVIAATTELCEQKSDAARRSMYWAAFTVSTKNAVAALVRSAALDTGTRSVGHRIKNFEEIDPVFKYLLHVRNLEAHAEDHDDFVPNPVRNQTLLIGNGAIAIEGSGSLTITNSNLNGQYVENAHIELSLNGVVSATGTLPSMAFQPMQIEFKPVTDRQKRSHQFPMQLVPLGELPEVFAAKYVVQKLEEWETELRLVRPDLV